MLNNKYLIINILFNASALSRIREKNGGPDGKTDGRKRKKSGALAAAAPDCSHERRVMLRAHCCFL